MVTAAGTNGDQAPMAVAAQAAETLRVPGTLTTAGGAAVTEDAAMRADTASEACWESEGGRLRRGWA